MNLKEYIASVPNYPKEGIIFRDISPLMANGKLTNTQLNKLLTMHVKLVLK